MDEEQRITSANNKILEWMSIEKNNFVGLHIDEVNSSLFFKNIAQMEGSFEVMKDNVQGNEYIILKKDISVDSQ